MEHEFKDGRLFLQRTPAEKQPITSRLSKIEGQIRGIRQMIEDNRHVREVAILIASQHLEVGMRLVAESPGDPSLAADLTSVLRAAMKAGDGY